MCLRGRVLLFVAGLLLTGPTGMEARASGKLLGLRTVVEPDATSVQLQVPTPVQFFTSRIGTNLFLVDMTGVSTERSADSQPVQSPLVSSYRLLNYEGADNVPHLALEITLKEPAEIETVQSAEGLLVKVLAANAPLAKAPAAGQAAAIPASAPVQVNIREVSVIQLEDVSTLEVEIVGDGKLETYRTLRLSNPERLVVDIPNTVNRIRQKQLDINIPPLRSVRIAQFQQRPPVSRIVLDLDSRTEFDVRQESNSLVVTLGSSSLGAVGAAAAVSEPTHPAETAALTEETDQDQEPQPAVYSAPANPFAPREPVLLASNSTAGIGAASMREVSLEGTPESPVPSSVAAGVSDTPSSTFTLSPEPLPESSVQVAPVQEMDPIPAETAVANPAPATSPYVGNSVGGTVLLAQNSPLAIPAQGPGQQVVSAMPLPCFTDAYTGEPVAVDLRDVDLKDFFRLMHEISGLNIVLDPGVSGTVTIVLDEVPWDQAMHLVLQNNGLECQRRGNVVRIAKIATLEAEARAQLSRAQAEAEREQRGQPTTTVTRNLSYATAATLIPTLKRFLSPRGEIVPDARTNMLIITDIPANIGELDRLIGTLDRKSQQVEIEARIVVASRSFARDIGTQLAASGLTGNVVLGGTGLVGESSIKRGEVPPLFIGTPPKVDPNDLIPKFANVAQPLLTNFPAAATSGTSFLISGGSFALDAILTAAESKGVARLLSRPKVITQNHVEAVVKQGSKIPIQTTINNTVSVQFVDVVLRLTVTPQITAEGTIFLKTDVENTTIDEGIARIQGVPGLATQQATTEVMVSNGGTVFFGGVIRTLNSLTESQVPLLGSIPLVGNLFKRRATSSSTQELLFFITPRIVQT
ncbi:MAG: type IV pilus secretin PilQ [Acidobacteria bacterium]|nr:type IV pilus secretin PilQ [Acidobacteriota bacterium]